MARDEKGYGLATVTFTLVTAVLALVALAVAAGALARSDDAKKEASKANGVRVTLSEFQIDPSTIEVPADGSLTVANAGTAEHNLVVKDTDLKTANLKGGASAALDVGSLDAGMYEVFCDIPGHADAGMKAMLAVGDTAGMDHGSGAAAVNTDANDADDARMAERTKAFPAETKGLGAQPMAPEILADGTKQFELTAKAIDWEVEPGKIVKAMAYNNEVPGPMIKVSSGDKVRVILHNELSESTSIHFHGILTPNSMDGVPDITQPPVKPGEDFTYEFVARGPAVGTYHSHHHAERQVPDGLFGPFIIGDPPVPVGTVVSQELPIVLNDAGAIGLSLNGKSFPATAPIVAKLGENIVIHYMNEGMQVHPMHLHGMVQTVIAKDGIPLAQPYQADTVLVGPGERYTVLVAATEPGTWAFHCHILNHAERSDGMFGMVTAFVVQ